MTNRDIFLSFCMC